MAEKYSKSIVKAEADPETEEEFLTYSESGDIETSCGSGSLRGVALVDAIPMEPDSNLAALDRKMMSVDRFMDLVAYWQNKPPTVEELTKARDDRLKWEETWKTLAKQRGNHSAVSFNIETDFTTYWFFMFIIK